MPDKASKVENYYLANVTPEKTPDALSAWWGAGFCKFFSYTPFKVRFLKREVEPTGPNKKDTLFFTLVGDVDGEIEKKLGNFEVDLKEKTADVWPYLPSTVPSVEQLAQLSEGDSLFGFLLLSKTWVETKQTSIDAASIQLTLTTLAEGGKWPLAGGDSDLKRIHAIAEQIAHPGHREELLKTLQKLENM